MGSNGFRIWAAALVLAAGQAWAATYYVEASGADANDGLSRAQAFGSISKGVAALQAGDTLEVGPGVYHEQVAIEKSGEPDKPITIRARYPGRTFLKGSVVVEGWQPVKGYSFVFRAPMARKTSLAHEADTGAELLEVANLNDLEQTPGGFLYDADQKTLYVHPTDSAGMGHHVIEASVLDYGFVSQTAKPFWNHTMRRVGVVIEGFVVSGYQEGGVMIRNADHCHVRNCVAYHTRAGIFFHGAWRSSITGCVAFRNNDRFFQEMGNIGIMSYSVNCLLENNVVHSTPQYGIRFYGGFYGCAMRGNLAWDCATGIHVKGQFGDLAYAEKYLKNVAGQPKPEPGEMRFERNVAHDCLAWSLIANACESEGNTGVKALNRKGDKTSLFLAEADVAAAKFADAAYHDLRLQSDSPWVKAGPGGKSLGAFQYADEVFYVGPDGDDSRRGTSVSQAWKTLKRACGALKAGQTLYILPGEYKASLDLDMLSGDRRTFVRAYGKGVVTLEGEGKAALGLRVAGCARVSVEGIQFRGFKQGARLERSRDVELKECAFFDNAGPAVSVTGCEGARVMSCALVFNAGPAVAVEGGLKGLWVAGNVLRDNAGPALALGALAQDETFFSDFNNVSGAAAETGGKALSLAEWRKAWGQDAHSFDLEPGFVDAAKRDLRLKPDSLCRGRGYLGQAAGPGRLAVSTGAGLEFKDVCVQNVTPSTADLSWTSRGRPTTVAVRYGERADKLDREVVHNTVHFYRTRHVFTLDGLRPETKYYFQVGERRLLEGGTPYHQYNYSWPELTPAGEAKRYEGLKKEDVFDSATYAFVTPKEAAVSNKAYWVSPNGDDAAAGSEAAPWKTVGKACAEARPGDRVTLRAGTYTESIRPMR
ncbi:MAG TPA: right-handed parallel beta-helix repeat-containing protein, partial [Candidatus Brocadiia bacterium]|nr:right-handed parallel beta-helix repeat-containing protein [Candidatus Brocadiia bacterium]